MILKQTRQIVAEERKILNVELKQYCEMYKLLNVKGHLGQLFSRQERCRCLGCKRSIDFKCSKKHVTFYLKTIAMTQKVKIFHIGRDLFTSERQITRCRELAIANPLDLECFLAPSHYP